MLAVIAPTLLEHLRILPSFYYNAPTRLQKVNTLGSYEVRFQNQIRSCEDVLLIEDHHLAIMACDAGRERWNTVMVRGKSSIAMTHIFNNIRAFLLPAKSPTLNCGHMTTRVLQSRKPSLWYESSSRAFRPSMTSILLV